VTDSPAPARAAASAGRGAFFKTGFTSVVAAVAVCFVVVVVCPGDIAPAIVVAVAVACFVVVGGGRFASRRRLASSSLFVTRAAFAPARRPARIMSCALAEIAVSRRSRWSHKTNLPTTKKKVHLGGYGPALLMECVQERIPPNTFFLRVPKADLFCTVYP
jgi:hypothetical protein